MAYSGLNAYAYGNYLMYESGTNGLLPATFLNAIGSNTEACLVHMHPGNVPQLVGIKFSRRTRTKMYLMLRDYYQGEDSKEDENCTEHLEPCIKRPKLQSEIEKEKINNQTINNVVGEIVATRTENDSDECKQTQETTSVNNDCNMKPLNKVHVQQKWPLENRRACLLMREKFDSLQPSANLVRELLQFIKPSRLVVIFSLCREVLTEL
uniref:Uncharacterized protein n=1 Tax=Glossina morsitans morsitans TaxID=37546 RepID=A0A1B0FAS9_GLOMM